MKKKNKKDQEITGEDIPDFSDKEFDEFVKEYEAMGDESLSDEEGEFVAKNEPIYSWKAQEFNQFERGRLWYIVGVLIIALIVVLSILVLNNFLMAVTFILIALIFYIYTQKTPRQIDVILAHGGLEVDGVFYDYENMRSFWIFYNDNDHQDSYISIQRDRNYLPYIHVPIGETDPTKIREELKKRVVEKKHKEDVINIVERMFKL